MQQLKLKKSKRVTFNGFIKNKGIEKSEQKNHHTRNNQYLLLHDYIYLQ